jgi:hypothetical protein
MPRVWFLTRILPVAWKLSKIEEWRQDRSCLFWRGECKNKAHNSRNFLGSILGKDVFVAQKLSTIEKWCQGENCLFGRGDYRSKGQNPKKCLDLKPDGDGLCSSETGSRHYFIVCTTHFRAKSVYKIRHIDLPSSDLELLHKVFFDTA